MYGDIANKLVQDARRIQGLDRIPAYQGEIVRAVTREIRDINRDIGALTASFGPDFDPAMDRRTACALFVYHLSMRRNKRCLMAYERVRADKIKHMVWDEVDLEQGSDQGVLENLSPSEQEYLHSYTELIVDYKGEWTDVDLTGPLEPPKDLFIDVRVLRDAGEIQTEYGVFNLTRNSQFYVRQADVQRLIQQGYLQRMSN